MLWSRRHPDFVPALGAVDLAQRRQGIGSALLRALHDLADRPLLLNVDSSEPGAEPFLTALGGRKLTESTTVRLGVRGALAGTLAGGAAPGGIYIEQAPMSAEIEDLYDALYAERHRWAGRSVSPPGAPWISLAGSVIEPTLFVARTAGADDPVAVTSLLTGTFASGADAFLAPTGVLGYSSGADGFLAPTGVLGYSSRADGFLAPTGVHGYSSRADGFLAPTGVLGYASGPDGFVAPTGVLGYASGADGFVAPTGVHGYASGPDRARPGAARSHAVEIVRALLGCTLMAGLAAGLETINLEYDTDYVELAALAAGLVTEPVERRSAWSSDRPDRGRPRVWGLGAAYEDAWATRSARADGEGWESATGDGLG